MKILKSLLIVLAIGMGIYLTVTETDVAASLFSGVGLIGVVVALHLQRVALKHQEKALHLQGVELKRLEKEYSLEKFKKMLFVYLDLCTARGQRTSIEKPMYLSQEELPDNYPIHQYLLGNL